MALPDPVTRQRKPFTDPLTARVGGAVFMIVAAGGMFLGSRALVTGCIRIMRGRHGPGVLHCVPETSYWAATTLSLVLGAAAALVGWTFLRIARRDRRSAPPGH